MDSQQIELLGRAVLTSALIREGFEIAEPQRDLGIDILVYQVEPSFAALPVQVKASTGTRLVVDHKYDRFPSMVFAYVWNVDSPQPGIFLLSHEDAAAVIGERAWKPKDSYSIPRAGKDVAAHMSRFAERWDWLRQQLGERTLTEAA